MLYDTHFVSKYPRTAALQTKFWITQPEPDVSNSAEMMQPNQNHLFCIVMWLMTMRFSRLRLRSTRTARRQLLTCFPPTVPCTQCDLRNKCAAYSALAHHSRARAFALINWFPAHRSADARLQRGCKHEQNTEKRIGSQSQCIERFSFYSWCQAMTSTLLMGDLYYEHLLLVLFIRLQISLLSHSFTLCLSLSLIRVLVSSLSYSLISAANDWTVHERQCRRQYHDIGQLSNGIDNKQFHYTQILCACQWIFVSFDSVICTFCLFLSCFLVIILLLLLFFGKQCGAPRCELHLELIDLNHLQNGTNWKLNAVIELC